GGRRAPPDARGDPLPVRAAVRLRRHGSVPRPRAPLVCRAREARGGARPCGRPLAEALVTGGPPPLVRLERAARTYRDGAVAVEALRPVDLSVAAGEYLAVTGPSGSGICQPSRARLSIADDPSQLPGASLTTTS